jgi:hypothetical protein
MSDPYYQTAFGSCLDDCFLVARHSEDPGLSVLCRLEGDVAREEQALPFEAGWCWRSDNGAVYFPSESGLYRLQGGRCTEIDGPEADEPLSYIAGWSGPDPAGDQLFIAEMDGPGLHRRSEGGWSPIDLPTPASLTNAITVARPDAVYLTVGEGLVFWDGRGATMCLCNEEPLPPACHPIDDELLCALSLGEDRLFIVGTESLWDWNPGADPEEVESPAPGEHCVGVARLGDDLFVASSEGIVRRRGGSTERVDPTPTVTLVPLADGLIALGLESGARIFDGARWRPVSRG